MYSWLRMQSSILDEIVSLDGPGGHRLDLCSACLSQQPASLYRCLECHYSLLHCSECIIKSHKALPLHRLEVGLYIQYTIVVKLTPRPALAEWVL